MSGRGVDRDPQVGLQDFKAAFYCPQLESGAIDICETVTRTVSAIDWEEAYLEAADLEVKCKHGQMNLGRSPV